MSKRKKYILLAIIGIVGILGLVILITNTDPYKDIVVLNFAVPPIMLVSFAIFLSTSTLLSTILASIRRGLLLGSFFSSITLLQFFKINSIFYIILLLIIIILIDVLFWKKN